MISSFAILRSVAFKSADARSDSPVFRLHYSFTVLFFAAASLLTQGGNWFGGAIHCAFNKKLVSHGYVEALCWVNGTYYNVDEQGKNRLYDLEAAPFITPAESLGSNDQKGARFVLYYQWAALMFCFEALMFYVPRWFWKQYEGGLLCRLLDGHVDALATFFCQRSKGTNWYMTAYLLAEVMAFVNLVGQVILLDIFLDGQFLDYGLNAAVYAYEGYYGPSPMMMVFPRVTKCSTKAFAMNGNLDKIEALCVLPLNVLNEKIFLFVWFWFAVLAVLTTGLMAFRIVVCASPRARLDLLIARLETADRLVVRRVFKRISIGDWFVLYSMAPHADLNTMSELLLELDRRTGGIHPVAFSKTSLSKEKVKNQPGAGEGQPHQLSVPRTAQVASGSNNRERESPLPKDVRFRVGNEDDGEIGDARVH